MATNRFLFSTFLHIFCCTFHLNCFPVLTVKIYLLSLFSLAHCIRTSILFMSSALSEKSTLSTAPDLVVVDVCLFATAPTHTYMFVIVVVVFCPHKQINCQLPTANCQRYTRLPITVHQPTTHKHKFQQIHTPFNA